MGLWETLIQPRIFVALLLFALISILVELAAHRLLQHLSNVAVSEWLVKHGVLPAARTLSLMTFILIAYPVMFGLDNAPGISDLLGLGLTRFMELVNIIFLLSLVLPLLPLIRHIPALILPLQGIASASLVFYWLANSQGLTQVHFWPGGFMVLGLLILAFVSHELALWLARYLELRVNALLDRQGSSRLIYRASLMLMQAPVILLYSLSLGRQLA